MDPKQEQSVRRRRLHPEGALLLTGMVVLFAFTLIYLYYAYRTRVAFWITAPCLFILSVLAFRFFRFPNRVYPGEEGGAVVAPSDGVVVVIEEVFEPEVLRCNCIQMSIFMSIFDVHAQWVPVEGRATYVRHHSGQYMPAYLPKSSVQNERSTILFETKEGQRVLMRQVAGAVARRVVTYLEEGKWYRHNEDLGFIKFGSRIDLYLPLGSEICVQLDDPVRGNLSTLARLPKSPLQESE
ncbi:MAG: phosphatidylserine decarboxylase family protein [Porphyromonas sp.]|nr:phosphatidylserine decarboxylase family protein [Porphyromonas sp.]